MKRARFRRWRRNALRTVRRAPKWLQITMAVATAVSVCFAVNWLFQVIRKPSELLFPVSGTLNKAPADTWQHYGHLFEEYSTAVISPDLLAALAQVEGSGNPLAQTYWRWSLQPHPFELYRPASSSVGMYQITNGTFADARRYCIRRHVVILDGPWDDWRSCWFNGLYVRILPAHAVELTAAYLDRAVVGILDRHEKSATFEQKQELAALIHLCGAGAGDLYVKRGMRLTQDQRCGDHSAREYVARVTAARKEFRQLRGEG